ncbi:hypothetical protein ACLMJK_008906 [Lecanora helva]
MGRKGDQDFYTGKTHRPVECRDEEQQSPTEPLSDCATAIPSINEDLQPPPSYGETVEATHQRPLFQSLSSQDPRSSSFQSLIPDLSNEQDDKRTLLLVYIHGFMGNETSFQSFPAHVHNVVTAKLAESHVVHTKIYPRYKSRKRIEVARDAFSEWLRPHESPETDVILLGHSMGGLISAEVALLDSHRILGTINFDTPFLGMHPGVIASGISSLFQPAPESPLPSSHEAGSDGLSDSRTSGDDVAQSTTSSSYFRPQDSSASTLQPTTYDSSAQAISPAKDPNYDPPFPNDVRIPERSFWSNALHFINKHSDGLAKATQAYVESHLEFGGAMADYASLRRRYDRLRALEDGKSPEGHPVNRIRFVNYYTASSGRPKKVKKSTSSSTSRTQSKEKRDEFRVSEDAVESVTLDVPSSPSSTVSHQRKIDISKDDWREQSLIADNGSCHEHSNIGSDKEHEGDEYSGYETSEDLNHIDPAAEESNEHSKGAADEDRSDPLEASLSNTRSNPDSSLSPASDSIIPPPDKIAPNLPPIPSAPKEPSPFDPNQYTDKDTRKLAEKDHARLTKAYKQRIKDRDKAIAERRKYLEKREKNAAKERDQQRKLQEKERLKLEQRGMEKGELERAKAEREEVKRQEKEKMKAEKAQQTSIKKQEKLQAREEKEATKKVAKITKTTSTTDDTTSAATTTASPKPPRDKKFCLLPSSRTATGEIDPCWVRIFMPGVDEVGAHCGLFVNDGARYEGFVDEVAGRIWEWVGDGNGERGREGEGGGLVSEDVD